MKGRLATLVAFAFATALASTLEGASPRIALSGGPLARSERTLVVHASPPPVRALQPGEMLVLGPIAGPVMEPSDPMPVARAFVPPPAASEADVDTVTVRPPASVPETPRASRPAESWEGYRTGNVVRIDLR